MKVLMINGSPNNNGATMKALKEMEKIFIKEKIEVEIVNIEKKDIRGCIDCKYCFKNNECVYKDIVNEISEKFKDADGLVIGSPVYYASANGTLISLLDRLFRSSRFDKTMKVGASIAVARRGGITATFDQLNKYFTICGMPIASGQYWNGFHGSYSDEEQDQEGLQQMRTLAYNMSFLIKSIKLGKEKYGLPIKEENRHLLKKLGTVFYLKATEEIIYNRLKTDTTRPLLQGDNPKQKIKNLMEQREEIYCQAADVVVEVDNKEIMEIVEEIKIIFDKRKNKL